MDYDWCYPRLIDVEETIDSFCKLNQGYGSDRTVQHGRDFCIVEKQNKCWMELRTVLTVNLKPSIYTYITVNVIYKVYIGKKNGAL